MATKITERIPSTYYAASPIRKRIKSFEDYLISKASTYKDDYSDTLKKIAVNRELSSSGYGRRAEGLSSAGLADSGYAAYLDRLADERADMQKASALSLRDEQELKAKASYADYLERGERALRAARTRTADRVVKGGVTSLEKAMTYALEEGLDRDEALEVARSAVDEARTRVTDSLLYTVLDQSVPPDAAALLADSHGLGGEYKDAIVKLAESLQHVKDEDISELVALMNEYGSSDSPTGDRLAIALDNYIKKKLEERNNSNEEK